jgi:hypothetical protein
MKYKRSVRPKIKWSSRKKKVIISMRKQQRGGFITALVVAAGNAIAAAGPRIAQIVAQQLPAIVGGLIGASRGVITQIPTAGREVARTLGDLAGRGGGGMGDAAVGFSVVAIGAAGLAVTGRLSHNWV